MTTDPPARSAADPCAFVVYGVTGDLARRKLLPALWALHRSGALHEDTRIVGYARSVGDDAALRRELRDALQEHEGDVDDATWQRLASRIHAVRGAYGDADAQRRLRERLDGFGLTRRLFYTATPPGTYASLVDAMHEAGLPEAPENGWTRLVVEKPFGHDLDSAQRLNERLLRAFDERQIYRIDHYLAKETAQNLAVLRFANALFEPTWSNRYVDHVQITMSEPDGVAGRGGFYEEAGVVRDVFQNHLLQLLALVAMEPPARWDADAVRDEKVKVFRATACCSATEAVFGQYVAADGVRGYREEDDVAPDSTQATYAAVRFEVRTWRWAGVPFFVRSGKRLPDKASEIVLEFRTPPHVPFDLDAPLRPDRLVLRLTPDEGIRLVFNAKRPGSGIELGRAGMDFGYRDRFGRPTPDAYETLLLDAMLGDATLFMRADEIEAQWRIVSPLLQRSADEAPEPYPAGSAGPAAADALLGRTGRRWHEPGGHA